MRRLPRTTAQALVEFALAAVIIFMLLSAAVDLGLVFFSRQQLVNASTEGAMYGSRFLTSGGGTPTLDIAGIRQRVRNEAGSGGGINIANLMDLNANGVDDLTEAPPGCTLSSPNNTNGCLISQRILVFARVADDINSANCTNPAQRTCYVFVQVLADYRPAFALAPALGDSVRLQVQASVPIRSGAAELGASSTPVILTPTSTPTPTLAPTPTTAPSPTPTATPIPFTLNIVLPATDNQVFTTRSQLQIQAEAYTAAGPNGNQIRRVTFRIVDLSTNQQIHQNSDNRAAFCEFGGNGPCSSASSSIWNSMADGRSFMLIVTAETNEATPRTIEQRRTFIVDK